MGFFRILKEELKDIINNILCWWKGHHWVDWGRKHCDRCGAIHPDAWDDLEEYKKK